MRVSNEAFERLKRMCENPPRPSAALIAFMRPELKGRTIFCDPDPNIITQLIERGRLET